ncbi:MAG: leucine-rich repeat domain-containing protein [Muribaculum sp.]|nr:leucine-rich repeat domain-containing protein [Muribaculum sp.]
MNIDFGSDWITKSWNLYINGECISDFEIPNSVTDINPYAFYCCSSIKSLKISNSVTSIGYHAFYYCKNLNKIEFESTESLWNIDFGSEWLFEKWGSKEWNLYINGECIADLEVPNSVTDIDPDTFNGCKSLISLKISGSVTSIGDQAFANCINLHKIEFESIESLFNIKFGASWKYVKSGGWDLYIGSQLISDLEIPNSASELENIFMHCMSLESVKIPETICKIGKFAFYDCKCLKSVDIPESVTEICDYAFDTCRDLDVKLPSKLSVIGTHAFSYCWNASETLDIPESVVSIGSNSFYNYSKLKWLKLPTNIAEIGSQAFDNCFAIKTVEYMSENPCTAPDNIFLNSTYSNATLYIPAGTTDKYMETQPWKNFKNIVEVQLTGIDEISEDNSEDGIDYSAPYEVYNFTGLKLNDTVDQLQPGLYIIRQGNTTQKLKL